MELPRIGKSDKGMFDGIKSKLGFGGAEAAYDDDEYYGDYADEYGEGYEEEYGEYGEGYSDDQYGSRDRGSARSSRSGAHSPSMPRLVSIDDVRANTQVPESLKRDPLPPRHASSASSYTSGSGYRSSYGSSRQVERAADYLRSTETSDLPSGVQRSTDTRSEGLNSLFASTAAAAASTATATSSQTAFDPYEAYAGSGAATHSPTRSLSVLKPASYGEVERVAKIVKAGDVVVLSLRNTPDHLAKRILDFSFGVSSALDASVECIADKVFVILRGDALSAVELSNLRNQGVL